MFIFLLFLLNITRTPTRINTGTLLLEMTCRCSGSARPSVLKNSLQQIQASGFSVQWVRSVRAWSSSNITLSMYFNQLTFSCFNYVIQITSSLIPHENHSKIKSRMQNRLRRKLEHQRSNTGTVKCTVIL